jgi:small subunit ribosomal protein S6
MPVERQREYETIYIMRPASEDDQKMQAADRLKGIIENEGGHILSFDDWGVRRLSYRIKDPVENARYYEQGLYQYLRFLAPNHVVAEIERNLGILDTVLKYMTVKIEEDLIPAERLSRVDEPEPEYEEE